MQFFKILQDRVSYMYLIYLCGMFPLLWPVISLSVSKFIFFINLALWKPVHPLMINIRNTLFQYIPDTKLDRFNFHKGHLPSAIWSTLHFTVFHKTKSKQNQQHNKVPTRHGSSTKVLVLKSARRCFQALLKMKHLYLCLCLSTSW